MKYYRISDGNILYVPVARTELRRQAELKSRLHKTRKSLHFTLADKLLLSEQLSNIFLIYKYYSQLANSHEPQGMNIA